MNVGRFTRTIVAWRELPTLDLLFFAIYASASIIALVSVLAMDGLGYQDSRDAVYADLIADRDAWFRAAYSHENVGFERMLTHPDNYLSPIYIPNMPFDDNPKNWQEISMMLPKQLQVYASDCFMRFDRLDACAVYPDTRNEPELFVFIRFDSPGIRAGLPNIKELDRIDISLISVDGQTRSSHIEFGEPRTYLKASGYRKAIAYSIGAISRMDDSITGFSVPWATVDDNSLWIVALRFDLGSQPLDDHTSISRIRITRYGANGAVLGTTVHMAAQIATDLVGSADTQDIKAPTSPVKPIAIAGETVSIQVAGHSEGSWREVYKAAGPAVPPPASPLMSLLGFRGLTKNSITTANDPPPEAPRDPRRVFFLQLDPYSYRVVTTAPAMAALNRWNLQATSLFYALALLEGFLFTFWFVFRQVVLRRIRRLSLATSATGSVSIPDAFPDLRSRDEIGVLSRAFYGLLRITHEESHRRDQERSQREAEREIERQSRELEVAQRAAIDAWRAKQIGHNVKSRLNTLSILVRDNAPARKAVEYILRSVSAISESDSLPQVVEGVPIAYRPLDLTDFLKEMVGNLKLKGVINLAFETDLQNCFVNVDDDVLGDVLIYIIENAEEFRTPDSMIDVRLFITAGNAVISIYNDGTQIQEADLERIFDLDVSIRDGEKRRSGNLGSGLFQARAHLAKMNGFVIARNTDAGVAFDIRLPLTNSA